MIGWYLISISVLFGYVHTQKQIVCYYSNWAQYRLGAGKFFPKDIDPNLCTHLVHAFAKIEASGLKGYEWNDISVLYPQAMQLKEKNPNLKILLAVGGWTHDRRDGPRFSTMVSSNATINTFVSKTVSFLRQHKFDGLDLDWEYPAVSPGSPAGDKLKFVYLCESLKKAFEKEAIAVQKPRLLLTAAVAAGSSTINSAYMIEELGNYLDSLHLMAYDLSGSWEARVGHHTAMFTEDPNGNSVSKGLQIWIDGKFPAEKIVLGLATYGRSFRLTNPSNHKIGDSASGGGTAGQFTGEAGYISYYEICQKISEGYTVVRDKTAKAPYCYKGDQWIGYEDAESLRYKVQTLILAKGLKGAMFWELPLDDFTGSFCGDGRYPLVNSVKTELTNSSVVSTVTTTPTSSSITETKSTGTDTTKPTPQTTLTTTTTTTTTTETTTETTRETATTGGSSVSTGSSTTPTKLTPIVTISTAIPVNPVTVSTSTVTSTNKCFAINAWYGDANQDSWCELNCSLGNCLATHCSCDPNWKPRADCFGINSYYGSSIMDDYCNANCDVHCPSNVCSCDPNWKPNDKCKAIGPWKGQSVIDDWCNNNCAVGNCPSSMCECSS